MLAEWVTGGCTHKRVVRGIKYGLTWILASLSFRPHLPPVTYCVSAEVNYSRNYMLMQEFSTAQRDASLVLTEHHTAINQQRLPGHIIGVGASQKRYAGGNVFRF